MEMKNSFEAFLHDIRPTASQREDMRKGHRTLRRRLLADEELSPIIIGTFIQGSYRRATAVRPKGDERSDVDVVVVTNIPRTESPSEAQARFHAFAERHYAGRWRPQGRSIGISLSYVDLDLVITSAPSEAVESVIKSVSMLDQVDLADVADDSRDYVGLDLGEAFAKATSSSWKDEALYIPNRQSDQWEPTHPLAQIEWTQSKNARTNRHYVNVVKALKWWRRINPNLDGQPKGYPLEHLIGQCCPDDLSSVASGLTLVLENMVARYGAFASAPWLSDHGVPSHNVLGRVQDDEWRAFIDEVRGATVLARNALDATTLSESSAAWIALLGNKFPASMTESTGLLASATATSLGFQSKPGGPKKPGGFA